MEQKVAKILVVDDSDPIRTQLKSILQASDFVVVEANDGAEAVKCYLREQPDLVLMDIQMPVMNGYEATRRIKAAAKGNYIPVIFISAEDDELSIAKALDSGGDDFVPKPANFALLRAKINVQLRIRTLNNSLQQNIQLLESEVEEQKRTQHELQEISNYDSLTDLPNRHFFLIYLAQALDGVSGEQMALLTLDIANFKRVNDVYGHKSGDLILQKVVQRMQQILGEEVMIGRIGGDHFAIFLENIESGISAEGIASEVMAALIEPYPLGSDEVTLGVNIGIALYPEHCDSAESMMRSAGTALDYARNEGSNSTSFFEQKMKEQTETDHEIDNAIYGALEREEFELYYQPQVDANNRQIVGCEVLIRWHHPTLGMVPPDRFIPLLEQKGMIREVGDWILRESIRQHLEWLERGHGVRIAVNFSALQLQEDGLAEKVIGIIRESGVAPPWFKLEITETATIDNLSHVAECLHSLRAAGLQVAVDDFGTGYSTLNYLQKLPVDIIKIDQQFIRDIPFSSEDMTLVKAVIAMAHSMGLDVVAEGVETEEQAQFLRKHMCEELQGYFFSRPLPAKEFEALLSGQKEVDEEMTLF